MKKQSQNKPNLPNAQMNISSVLTKDYERNDIFAVPENKPNSNPISKAKKCPSPVISHFGKSRLRCVRTVGTDICSSMAICLSEWPSDHTAIAADHNILTV